MPVIGPLIDIGIQIWSVFAFDGIWKDVQNLSNFFTTRSNYSNDELFNAAQAASKESFDTYYALIPDDQIINMYEVFTQENYLQDELTQKDFYYGETQAIWPLFMAVHSFASLIPVIGWFWWILTTLPWEVLKAITNF